MLKRGNEIYLRECEKDLKKPESNGERASRRMLDVVKVSEKDKESERERQREKEKETER